MPESDRREGALDGVRGAQVAPVLSREVVEAQERITILRQARTCRLVLHAVLLQEVVEGLGRRLPGLGQEILSRVVFQGSESGGVLQYSVGEDSSFENKNDLVMGVESSPAFAG